MMTAPGYLIPVGQTRVEIEREKSRFICTISCAASVPAARSFIDEVRSEFPNATHNVYAFQIGFGSQFTEGMSDDGEPSGTAAPPILTVIRGSKVGDIVVVVTRYYGGKNLGTGGLVRAYSDVTRAALAALPTKLKIQTIVLRIALPYPAYHAARTVIQKHYGDILHEDFTSNISIIFRAPETQRKQIFGALANISAGGIVPQIIADYDSDIAL